MNRTKRRLALLLSFLLVAPMILGCLPMTALKADAATTSVSLGLIYGIGYEYDSSTGANKRTLQVEAGQSFQMGDMVYTYVNDSQKYLSQVSGETYKSSKTSIATVSASGTVKPKNSGITTITVTYKGVKVEVELTVVKKGTFGSNSSTANSLRKRAKEVISVYGSGITSSNRYKLDRAMNSFYTTSSKVKSISYSGFKTEKVTNDWGTYYNSTNKLVVPEICRMRVIEKNLREYVMKYDPVGTVSGKWFKISSVSAKGGSKNITINLKSKVTSTQIFAIKYDNSYDTYLADDKMAIFPVWVKDKSTGRYYHGRAVVKQGSTKAALTMDYLKLKSGRTYQLIADDRLDEYGWTLGKTFKAK